LDISQRLIEVVSQNGLEGPHIVVRRINEVLDKSGTLKWQLGIKV
jgi:hypothetical protein